MSNCYEDSILVDGVDTPAYSRTELTITNTTYSTNSGYFSDLNCATPTGSPESSELAYTIGDTITASDGAPVTVMNLTGTQGTDEFPVEIDFDIEYRLSATGVELNFANISLDVLEIDYRVTYLKQL